jgi:hypothetical protein
MFRAEDLVERPAAIERFIMELLADPEPPPVSRPEVVFSLVFWYGTSKMLVDFCGSLCIGMLSLRVSFRVEVRMYFLQNRFQILILITWLRMSESCFD